MNYWGLWFIAEGGIQNKSKTTFLSKLQNSPYFCVGANEIACTLRAKDLEQGGCLSFFKSYQLFWIQTCPEEIGMNAGDS